ncbi:MAG: integrase [Candidatus Bathyarchaeia archaeon]
MGFEPTTFSLEAPNQGDSAKRSVDWVAFKKAIQAKEYHGYYGTQLLNLCLQYADCWVTRDLSKIKQLSPSMRAQTVKALSSLSKFQGCYEEYKQLLKNYGLTWAGRSADDLIIDRLTKIREPENVFKWIRVVKEACPEYSVFMDFIAVTGLRLSEAIHSYNLIVKLSVEGALAEKYYNVKTGFLEHFRYKETFIRSCKKAFLSYVPLELLESIGKQKEINDNHLKNRALERKHIPQRFSDVRENHASFTTKWLRPEEIDLLHGRVTGSVFMVHYYNPNLVTDLRSRMSTAAQAILVKVNSELILRKESGEGRW